MPRFVRVPPVAEELTGSWIRRMTAGYGLPAQDLLRSSLGGLHGVQVTGTPNTGLELFLNAPARMALARFTGLSLAWLTRLMPSLGATHSRLTDDGSLRAAWYVPCEGWVVACPPCTGRAWSSGRPVLVYPGAAGHICRRHRRWLLAHPGRPASIALENLPEVLTAHRHHAALVRAHPGAADVVALAAAVVWSWQVQGWEAEAVWQGRVRRLAAVTGCTPRAVVSHALVSYPETVAVARLLVNPRRQQRLRETVASRGVTAATEGLLQEIGRQVGRPWLADWLSARARTRPREAAGADPLRQWLLTVAHGSGVEGLWTVHQVAARPAGYSDRASFLAGSRPRTVSEEARAAFLIGGWEPVSSRRPGTAPCP
ncbi:hypothetical protein ABTZ59_33470 [Streptomyces sp. NPDC094034]|uniref:hypothetical protein n=1 Tax=Streptomyces sp. NPDC094034 TaxID=3155309 RepID=UPI00331A5946